jgi:1-aminocyclopropane-1-carboxylate deaminase/D-cysteine desulfhydrase-like pyridoxal-dependent ACC family enzyme
MLGAHLHWTGKRSVENVVQQIGESLRAEGHRPYTIPRGGSNPLGAVGYVWAMQELINQLGEESLDPDLIVMASASGGTQAGAVLGKKLYDWPGQILGISIEYPADILKANVTTLATDTATFLGLNYSNLADIVEVDDSYLGQGYGIVSEMEREALHLLARLEGILLDPVYTGRAMGGLIEQIRQGRWQHGQQVLFWHTGGTPALFAYGDELL